MARQRCWTVYRLSYRLLVLFVHSCSECHLCTKITLFHDSRKDHTPPLRTSLPHWKSSSQVVSRIFLVQLIVITTSFFATMTLFVHVVVVKMTPNWVWPCMDLTLTRPNTGLVIISAVPTVRRRRFALQQDLTSCFSLKLFRHRVKFMLTITKFNRELFTIYNLSHVVTASMPFVFSSTRQCTLPLRHTAHLRRTRPTLVLQIMQTDLATCLAFSDHSALR